MTEDSRAGGASFGHLPRQAQEVIDQLCDRFERELKSSPGSSIESLLPHAPRELRDHLLRELIALEVEHQQRRGDVPQLADYRRRFPSLEETWLSNLLQTECPTIAVEKPLPTTVELPEPPARLDEYDLLSELGRGGMGRVYLARHRRMDRQVAIKMLMPDLVTNPAALKRFHREVTMAAKLVHPNIVTAYDARDFEGLHFLVMEYVQGQDLKSLVAARGPLPLALALDYVTQAAKGLECAHQHGIVHRDVKPSNFLLDEHGVVKVLDLGLARLDSNRTTEAGRLTAPHSILGTLAFMAPEQTGDPSSVDHRADIYGLGCTLFYLLAGKPPFSSTSFMEMVRAHQRQPLPPLALFRSDVPQDLESLLRSMVAKLPSDRPQSMRSVVDALTHLTAAPPVQPPALSLPKLSRVESERRESVPYDWRLPAVLAAGIVVALLLCVPLAAWFWRSASKDLYSNSSATTRGQNAPPSAQSPFNADEARRLQQAWAQYLTTEPSLTNSLRMRFQLIPPGEFAMGSSEAPSREPLSPRRVRVEEPFYLQQTEVTKGQFAAFVEDTEYVTTAEQRQLGWGVVDGRWQQRAEFGWFNLGEQELTDQHPAVSLSWLDAVAFCRWLSEKEGVVYRLPTEAEWEYACRAGSESAWHFGHDGSQLEQHAWFAGNSGTRLHAVAQKIPNGFGVYDMLGNEMEWCLDAQDYLSPAEAQKSLTGQRALRGGAFNESAQWTTCAARQLQDVRMSAHGAFRVVREVPLP